MLQINDFFCGAGGMGLGFQQAGFEIAGAWDWDTFAVKSYAENVGSHVKEANISEMSASDVPSVHVWTFGFPCQDLSIAGEQAGLEGSRSRMFFEIMRLLDDTPDSQKPDVILAENVEQLKKYLPRLEQEYAKRGYRMTYVLYNSKYWGVPQNRERYFVVGTRSDKPFVFADEQRSHVPKLSCILESEVASKFFLPSERTAKIVKAVKQRHSDIVLFGRMQHYKNDQMNRIYDVNGIAPTLLVVSGGGRQHKIYDPAYDAVRYLTPREYFRLQGFSDDYKFVCYDTQLYKQAGNAVTVSVAKAVAEAIGGYLK